MLRQICDAIRVEEARSVALGTRVREAASPVTGLERLDLNELLLLCLESGRNELLWIEFIRRSQPLISGVVAKITRRWTKPTPALVDDLVQDTYVKLCVNDLAALRQFVCRHENALFGFLKVVASNTVQDHFRCWYSQKRGLGKDEHELDRATVLNVADTYSDNLERRVLLREIEDQLETCVAGPNCARDHMIFGLYYKHGLTAKQISRLPNINLTVKGVQSTVLRLTRLIRLQFAFK